MRWRAVLLAAGVVLAACGAAETAVFLVTITNQWGVKEDSSRSYLLNGPTCVKSGTITGSETAVVDGVRHEASLQGSFSVPSVEFTVQRTAEYGACADCTSCACVHFTGSFTAPYVMVVQAGSEHYTISRGEWMCGPPSGAQAQ
jgi:hypothetical protein